jgi:hypothetical protein
MTQGPRNHRGGDGGQFPGRSNALGSGDVLARLRGAHADAEKLAHYGRKLTCPPTIVNLMICRWLTMVRAQSD